MEISEDKVQVSLNPRFYDHACVIEALEAFKGLCVGHIENNVVTLRAKEGNDPQKIAYEFLNYVLALMKNQAVV